MYDMIGFHVPMESIDTNSDGISFLLSGHAREKDPDDPTYFVKGVRDGVLIKMSLPRLLYGSNESTLAFQDLPLALEGIEERLALSLDRSRLFQVEVGTTIPVEHPPSQYMTGWGPVPRLQMHSFNSGMTICYANKVMSFTGYDKAEEMRAEGSRIACHQFGLRLEYRRKKRLKDLFDREMSPWDLADSVAAKALLDVWRRWYDLIPKAGIPVLKAFLRTEGEMTRELERIGFQIIGHTELTAQLINSRRAGLISSSTFTRMKRRLAALASEGFSLNSGDLAYELDAKVNHWFQSQVSSLHRNVLSHGTDLLGLALMKGEKV